MQRFRQIWTPDLRVLDPDGFEYDAWQGYWPPAEFAARILLGRARGLARQQREQEAESAYEEVLRRFPSSYVAPEAAYWLAVCRYKRTHEAEDLSAAGPASCVAAIPTASGTRPIMVRAAPALRW